MVFKTHNQHKKIAMRFNKIDLDYQKLLGDILENGVLKKDRTGTGTISVFGRQIRHNMKDGFPLLTTKKMSWKQIKVELMWFLMGDTNIKFLVDNDCHIWDGDAYKSFEKKVNEIIESYKKLEMLGESEEINLLFSDADNLIMLSKEEFINRIKTDETFFENWGDLGPIYGKQWRNWNGRLISGFEEYQNNEFKEHIYGVDQITNLINDLKNNPDSRRLMVNAWNIGQLDEMVLPPCHYGFQVYTRELNIEERKQIFEDRGYVCDVWPFNGDWGSEYDGFGIPSRAISLMWNQRSVDTFLGLPFNIASYGLLLELIAKAVNMVPDELIGNLGDVHLYSNHIAQAKEQMERIPYELPTLNINTEFWPYEGGECGVGPLDAVSVFNSFKNEHFCRCLIEEDIQLSDYKSHPAIKAPLSN